MSLVFESDIIDALKARDDSSVDLVLLDPPYYEVVSDEWDNQWASLSDYLAWSSGWLQESVRVLKPGGSLMVFGYFPVLSRYMVFLPNLDYQDYIVWTFNRGGKGTQLHRRHEDILWMSKGSPKFHHLRGERYYRTRVYADEFAKYSPPYPEGLIHKANAHRGGTAGYDFHVEGAKLSNAWHIERILHQSKERVEHPTQKPIELIDRMVRMTTDREDVVLDGFGGSGTTALVCSRLRREYYVSDKDPAYVQMAQSRIDTDEYGLLSMFAL